MQPNEQQPNVPPQEPPLPPEPAQPVSPPPVPSQPTTQPPVQPVVIPEAQPVAAVPQPAQAPQEAVTTLSPAVQPPQVTDPASEAEVPQVDQGTDTAPTPLPQVEPVQWQAPEYIQHEKSPLWYVGFAAVIIVLMAAAILIMQAWTFAILIPVMAVALMVYSHRPPRQLNYVLSEKGIHINDQLHPMGEFKSFGIVQETEQNSLILVPVKRFRPGLTVYFPSEAGERIVDLLGGYLPMQDLHLDAFDKIVRKLRI